MKKLSILFVSLLACGISLPLQAAITATVSKNNYAAGESIQLQLQRDGGSNVQPDISPLKKDFDVLGSSSGSSVQIINGHVSSKLQLTILLSPKHGGKLQIPPLQWDGEQTAAIDLTVGGNAGASAQGGQAANAGDNVFLTSTLDQKQPYVQAAVMLTLRLYSDQSLYQASLDFPASSDVLVKQLGKDVQTNETRNGRTYQVIERKYLLFPQRSGKLSLNGPVLDAQVADNSRNDAFMGGVFGQLQLPGMLNATRPIRVRAKNIELNVQARPAAASSGNWLPAQKVTLEETWKPAAASVHVGEPLTRHIHLAALGLTGSQLPELSTIMTVPDGIKAYPDQSTVGDNTDGKTVLGSRDQDIALMATRAGHYELPEVKLHWWDTLHNSRRELTLPAHTFDVLPAIESTPTAMLPPALEAHAGSMEQNNATGEIGMAGRNTSAALIRPWQWLSLALALLWLGTAAAWWRARQNVQPQRKKIAADKKPEIMQSSVASKAFKRACNNNDATAARENLLAWAATQWADDAPAGLNELARRMTDANLAQELRLLDRACYTGSTWQGENLAQLIGNLPAQPITAANKNSLPGLYAE
jgi:hypothetical protein